jgi:phosphohistidine phosphatase
MKTLLLMRHAKSSWKDPDLTDHERPLNKRGKRDAPLMGELLKSEGLVPDVIYCSTAKRARKTIGAVIESTGYTGKIEYMDTLYMAEPYALIDILKSLPRKIDMVMLVGHNPGLEGVLQILSGEIEALQTSAVAQIKLKIKQWDELDGDSPGKLINLWRARELRKA